MTKTQPKSLLKPDSNVAAPAGYREFLNEIKEKIRNAQLKAAIAASRELIEELLPKGRRFSAPERGGKFLAAFNR